MKIQKYNLFFVALICNVITACSQPKEKIIKVLDSKAIRTESHTWVLTSVELRNDCTILEKYVCSNEEENTWIMSIQNEFIEDAVTGERYYIKESEIGFDSQKVILEGYKGRIFKEVYPVLPANVEFLNISTGSGYFLKSLDISHDISPVQSPMSNICFAEVNLGMAHDKALKRLKNNGYKQFYSEEEEGFWGGHDIKTYLQGEKDDYAVTIEIETSKERMGK